MDIIQFTADIVNAIARHGWSVTTFVVAVTALFRVNAIRRMLLKRLPRRFRHEDRLDSIQRDIKAIKAHLGVLEWGADSSNGKSAPSVTTGRMMKSLLPQAGYVTAIIAKFFTRLKGIYHYQQRRMNMKSKLFSRKFLMALATGILIVLNDGLGMGLDTETILYVVGIVGTWIVGESVVDVARKPQGGNDDGLYSSTKDSEGA